MATLNYGRPPRAWIRFPRVWSTVAFSRTVIPTPSSYAVVAGIGMVAGVGWNLLLGWPWWLGPIGFVVGAWLLYLSTAFRGAQRERTLRAIHDHLDPKGAQHRHEELNLRVIAEASFAAVGLLDHPEAPSLGGLGRRDDRLTAITLVYGDQRSETDSCLEITTSIRDDPPGLMRHLAEDELRRDAAGLIPLSTGDRSKLSAEIQWTPTEVVIDGGVHQAERAELDGNWMVVVETPDRSVSVQGFRDTEAGSLELSSRHPSELATGLSD